MADTKLSALTLNALPLDFIYGIAGGVSKKQGPSDVSLNVKNYGAIGNGVADDSGPIQDAINAAAAIGTTPSGSSQYGSRIYFPPGNYNLGSTGVNFNGMGNASIGLIGSGRECTMLFGAKTGYLIDKTDNGAQSLELIRGMLVQNNHASGGAIRMNGCIKGLIEDVLACGFIGIDTAFGNFGCAIRNVTINVNASNHPAGSIGAYISQTDCSAVRCEGFDVGFLMRNVGSRVGAGSSTESCNTGILVGMLADLTTADNCNGWTIENFQTERVGTAIDLRAGQNGKIAACSLTANIGPASQVQSVTWSGGLATVTSVVDLNWSGTRQIQLQTGTAYDAGFVAATSTSTTTFTIASADHGSVGQVGSWSLLPQYGIRYRATGGVVCESVSLGSFAAEQAGIDLYYDGNTSGYGNTFISVLPGAGGWISPPDNQKAGFQFIHCFLDTTMTFSLIEGGTGNGYPGAGLAIEGMERDITDGQKSGGGTATWGDDVQGGGSQHLKIRYNGTHWTCCGK